MISIIDHTIRANLNISPVMYMVCHACGLNRPLMKGTGISYLSDCLGLTTGTTSQAMKSLIEVGLLEKLENGYYYPTQKWYLAHDGEDVVVETNSDAIAKDVIDFFNELNDTKYHIQSSIELIRRIVKSNPKITADHFKSVIVHKHETWGNDDKMKDYNRPATLFSSKFIKYLDDANNYWLKKQKHDTSATLLGHNGK